MADAVDLGKTMPSTGLERFAGMALGDATLLDSGPIDPAPARPASGPTDLLAQARVGVSGPLSEPPKAPGEADTADPQERECSLQVLLTRTRMIMVAVP